MSPNQRYSLMQFADDTILMGNGSWSICGVLHEFSGALMVSGLRVNFFKSNLIGVNLPDGFLEVASTFLSCCVGDISFKFFGGSGGS